MPVISFANAKGGAGKTTAALLLATEAAARGYKITIFDADPQKWISSWYDLSIDCNRISIVGDFSPDSIAEQILLANAVSDYVVIDLEGTENLLIASSLSVSDLVLVPIQGSAMDARGGAKVLMLVRKLEAIVGNPIQKCVFLSRANAAITTRGMKAAQSFLSSKNVEFLTTPIVERAAYRAIFQYGGDLYSLDNTRVSGIVRAQENASLFASEVLRRATRICQDKREHNVFRFAG